MNRKNTFLLSLNCSSYDLHGALSLSRKIISFSLTAKSVEVIPSVLLTSTLNFTDILGAPFAPYSLLF